MLKKIIGYRGVKSRFDPIKMTASGLGVYFTSDPALAQAYSSGEDESVIVAELEFENPYVVDCHGEPWMSIPVDDDIRDLGWTALGFDIEHDDDPGFTDTDIIAEAARKSGYYDGVIFYDIIDSPNDWTMDSTAISDVYVVFDIGQIDIKKIMTAEDF